jgi:hypothetical protein
MKVLFVIIILVSCNFLATAQDEQQMAMMQAWQEYMTPGSMHEFLAASVGTWKTEITTWMDPSHPPVTTEGTSEFESILGGRYFRSIHKAEVMGMPMDGIEISGYDNARKKFFSSWIDNMGTGMMFLEGTLDENTNTITYTGTSTDPMGNEIKVKQVAKHIDKDNLYMEMYMDYDGNEVKSMEIKFSRTN